MTRGHSLKIYKKRSNTTIRKTFFSQRVINQWNDLPASIINLTSVPEFDKARGTSLIRKSVRDFFRTKGFIRIFDGFFLKTKGFLPKVYEIFWSEMPLATKHMTDT